MDTKTYKALNLFKKGFIKESINIFKTFRIGFTKEEKRTLEIASDCLNGHSLLYIQLGVDIESVIENSKQIINGKYR